MPNKHSNYRGKIPFDLYIRLENEFPRLAFWETDERWLARIMRDPNFPRRFPRFFWGPGLCAQVMEAVHQRWMALAGAKRVGAARPGPALIQARNPNAKATIADKYRNELLNDNGMYKHADQAYQLLLTDFDASTPANGSIFWNGINELALSKMVDEWNARFKNEIFGQLEATTAARYVNKKFVWEDGGRFKEYFEEISGRLGLAAQGHITSVVRCGLRNDSIFTTTELPNILKKMEDQIRAGQQPDVTDITIVVIEPKHLPERAVKAFTNHELSMVPIVERVEGARFISDRADCSTNRKLTISHRIQEYWTSRENKGRTGPSEAAKRIMEDCRKLVQWT